MREREREKERNIDVREEHQRAEWGLNLRPRRVP